MCMPNSETTNGKARCTGKDAAGFTHDALPGITNFTRTSYQLRERKLKQAVDSDYLLIVVIILAE